MTPEKIIINCLVSYSVLHFAYTVGPLLWQFAPIHLLTLPLLILTSLLFIWGAFR